MKAVALLAAAVLVGVPGMSHGRTPKPEASAARPVTTEGLARLKYVSARQSQRAWMAVKGLPGTRQSAAAAEQRLHLQVCDDLVDLRTIVEGAKASGFGFRDNVRQRTWARPTLALLLVTAMERFSGELAALGRPRERLVSIGDVSQEGCGQLAHGVLVFKATGARAEALRHSATLDAGRLVVEEIVTAREFPWEADRFGPPEERVLVQYELRGEDREGALRYARTRYRELPAPTPGEVEAMAREVEGLLRSHRVSQVKASSAREGAVHVSRAVDPGRERQVVVTTRGKPGRGIDWAEVLEVRLANWQDKKPGSMPQEVVWRVASVRRPPEVAPVRRGRAAKPPPLSPLAVTFSRWSQLSEAGHISHLSGIDVDLSYVTRGNERHFAVDLEAMDAQLTWRWFEVLVQTGRELGTPIESILVDGSVRRHLMASLPMKGKDSVKGSPIWRLLTVVGGHDAHHHVRIGEASDALERAARGKLGLR